MRSLRLALLVTCVAFPAMAQDAQQDQAKAAVADAQARVDAERATATANASTNYNATTSAQVTTVPKTMPPPIDPVSPDKPLTAKEKAGLSVARTWINKYQIPRLDNDGVEHFVAGKGQIFVVTAVVKPVDAGLSTNVVLETNKRTVSVTLTSRRQDYMPMVSLDIPEVQTRNGPPPVTACSWEPPLLWQAPATSNLGLDQYKITGDNVSWRPVQAYVVSTPVGMKTCIDFPSSIGSENLPALLALADDGGWFSSPTKKMVNVRFVHRRFIADELLTRSSWSTVSAGISGA